MKAIRIKTSTKFPVEKKRGREGRDPIAHATEKRVHGQLAPCTSSPLMRTPANACSGLAVMFTQK